MKVLRGIVVMKIRHIRGKKWSDRPLMVMRGPCLVRRSNVIKVDATTTAATATTTMRKSSNFYNGRDKTMFFPHLLLFTNLSFYHDRCPRTSHPQFICQWHFIVGAQSLAMYDSRQRSMASSSIIIERLESLCEIAIEDCRAHGIDDDDDDESSSSVT